MKTEVKKNVIWFSRHQPTPEQLAEIAGLGWQIHDLESGLKLGAMNLQDDGDVNAVGSALLAMVSECDAVVTGGYHYLERFLKNREQAMMEQEEASSAEEQMLEMLKSQKDELSKSNRVKQLVLSIEDEIAKQAELDARMAESPTAMEYQPPGRGRKAGI